MPRLLIVAEPPDGGVAVAATQLALGLGAHGYEVEFAGPADTGHYPRLERAGVRVHRLPLVSGFGGPLDDLRALARLTSLLRRGGFDLTYLSSSKAGAIGRLAARAAGVPAAF